MYFIALFPFLFQIRGLIGERGILPVSRFLNYFRQSMGRNRYWRIPTLFWINHSDAALVGVTAFGVFCSLLLIGGFSPSLLLPVLILIHLSIVTVGQDFLSFGWEGFLIEISCNAFLLTVTSSPNLWAWISLNILIFRFHFQAGTSKIQSGDPNWRNLTAIAYHYETQPIPSTLAWYFHKLPMWFHKCSTAAMFFTELVIPFLILGNEHFRFVAFLAFFSLQFFIWVSGNYSYLNHLTVVLCTLLLSDTYLGVFLSSPEPAAAGSMVLDVGVSAVAIVLIVLQLLQFWNTYFRTPLLSRLFYLLYPYHLINRYGIFAIMTTTRYEIVFEGSDDGHEWKEYLFYFKPSEVERRPRRIAPFQPRIDWQAWFLPFRSFHEEDWVQLFVKRLLEGEPAVLKLLRYNPFSDQPPKYVRAQTYIYKFSPRKIRKELGHWWVRTYLGSYSPAYKSFK